MQGNTVIDFITGPLAISPLIIIFIILLSLRVYSKNKKWVVNTLEKAKESVSSGTPNTYTFSLSHKSRSETKKICISQMIDENRSMRYTIIRSGENIISEKIEISSVNPDRIVYQSERDFTDLRYEELEYERQLFTEICNICRSRIENNISVQVSA